MPGTRKLGRAAAHRMAMLRAMVTFLLEKGKIETTLYRAKEVRSMTEKMITLAKENSLHNKRLAMAFITKEDVVKKLFDEIGGFDENYDPTCYEDTDISLKIRNVGKEIVYCPYLGIIHNPHQTTKSGSNEHSVLIKNKGDYFVKKWKLENKKLLNYRK